MNNIVVLCLMVFFARIIDTSFATVRTVMIVRDKVLYAVMIAFFEVFVWFLIVREALNSVENAFLIAIAYSAGYATGVFVGMKITDHFITTNVSVNIVVNQKKDIINALVDNNFAVSVSKIKWKDLISNKFMIFVATTNKRLALLRKIVTEIDDHAFIVVSENKQVVGGYK